MGRVVEWLAPVECLAAALSLRKQEKYLKSHSVTHICPVANIITHSCLNCVVDYLYLIKQYQYDFNLAKHVIVAEQSFYIMCPIIVLINKAFIFCLRWF